MESKGPKKQKLTKKSDQRSKPFGNKRRQEEQEKMRRLQRQQQMAALKKIPGQGHDPGRDLGRRARFPA